MAPLTQLGDGIHVPDLAVPMEQGYWRRLPANLLHKPLKSSGLG